MVDRILVINGHPDASPERLCSALADAYVRGAHRAGHEVRRLDIGAIDFPLIRSQAEFTDGEPPRAIAEAQAALKWANHLVILFPLWIGGPPALLKGFLEQVFRYGVALTGSNTGVQGLLKGRSARIVVTMGMPAAVFRVVFGGFGLKSLTRGLLWISGIGPIRSTVLGGVEAVSADRRAAWLRKLEALGAGAA